ncbi:MAG: nucleotidyltransferase family protein [Kiritimatiellae bacterium]|nr:nucleotidyltransferase family protein [Kiritimatiellia bacterium]
MTTAAETLICCLRETLGAGVQPGWEAPAPDSPDWPAVFELAAAHQVGPLLHRWSAAHPGALAGSVAARVERHALANAARAVFLTRRLFEILALLDAHGVQAIPFKGPVLAARLYGDVSRRRFTDLDFLVEARDMRRAKDALSAAGYRPRLDLTEAEEQAHWRAGWECALFGPDGRYSVEIDSGLAARHFGVTLDVAALKAERVELEVDGRPVRALSAENLLPILCVHGTKHLWRRLIWSADVCALLAAASELDAETVLRRAAALGARRMLLLGLAVASRLFDAPLPGAFAAPLERDRAAAALCRRVCDALGAGSPPPARWTATVRFHLRARERLRDRLRYVLLLAFTPSYSDWKTRPLPARLFPLYYLTRPFRLLGKLAGAGAAAQPRATPDANRPGTRETRVLDFEEFGALCKDLLAEGNAVRFRARGASMAPAIRDGDLITVAPVSPAAVRRGDVLLYRTGAGRLAAHRVTRRAVRGGVVTFTTRKDAGPRPAEQVAAAQVLGRAVACRRGARTIALAGPLPRLLAFLRGGIRRLRSSSHS